MSSHFYLFLPGRNNESNELDSAELNWVYADINNELKLTKGLLSDVAVEAVNHHVTIVLPGEDVLFLTADVPGKNIQHIQQAVPYVLEDSVIDDVDELHFSISKSVTSKIHSDNVDHRYNVAIINKYYFETIIGQLEKAGIFADSMIADYLLLPNNNTLFYDGTRILFNSSILKFASDAGSAVNLFDEALPENEKINLICCNNDIDNECDIEGLAADISKVICEENPLLYLVKNSLNEKAVNLLQGTYKKKKNWSKAGKTWFPAAVLFLVWLSVQGGLFIFDYINLSNQNKLLNTEITEIYKKAFPESHRIIDAQAQMKQKLNDLKKRKGQSGRSFTEMLSGSAGIFSKTKGLKIKSLRYYDGRINLELEIASLQALDKLKNQLNTEKGYQVEVQNASSGKEIVTARIQIIGAGL